METKTSKFVDLWKSGNHQEALAILHTFKMGFTKEEKEKIKICHEMYSNKKFYEAIGYHWESIKKEVFELVESKYFSVA